MMQITFGENGTLTLVQNGKTLVSDSTVGLLLVENTLYAPQTAVFAAGQLKLSYEMCEVRLAVKFRANGSCRLEVTEIPESADGFVFGPWRCAEAQSFGEELGAAWFADGAVVCIQSLNPKTVGGHEIYSSGGHTLRPVNRTGYPDPCVKAAGKAILKAFKNHVEGKGFSLIEVVSTCPTNWGMTPNDALKWVDENMIPYYPLGVYKDTSAQKEEK